MATRVEDPHDPRISPYRDVGDSDALRSRRVFVAEGRLVVERLIRGGRFTIESVVVTPAAHAAMAHSLACTQAPVFVCTADILRTVTGFTFHRGCIALAHRPETDGSLEPLFEAPRLLVLQAVGNPDNIGGIFRIALALGAGGVILDDRCGDPFYRKAIRTSMAATLRVPFARMALSDALPALKAAGFLLVALTPAERAVDISRVDPRAKTALLLGSEGSGLSPDVLALSDVRARIPIDPRADSLNVAVAAAVALHALR